MNDSRTSFFSRPQSYNRGNNRRQRGLALTLARWVVVVALLLAAAVVVSETDHPHGFIVCSYISFDINSRRENHKFT